MLKLSEKQHVIWVQGMETKTQKIVEKLANNFLDVSYEIVPDQKFANGETQIKLKESVREKYMHLVSNITTYPDGFLSSYKFNDLLMRDILIRQAAITHGAKWLSIDTIPYYNIEKQTHALTPEILPVCDEENPNLEENIIGYFEKKKRMFPLQQEKIHLIGTQDTANIVNAMQQYLISELGNHVVSSEISLYKESKRWMTYVDFQYPVENKHVYVVGDVNGLAPIENLTVSYNDRLMQILLLAHWAKKYRAKTQNVVLDCFPYSRQDKPIQWGLNERVIREPSSAQFIIDIMQKFLWVDYCLTMDIHNPAIINSSNETNFVNLYTWWMVQQVATVLKKQGKDLVLSPMDEWWLKKISSISKDLKFNYLTVLKKRDYSEESKIEEIFVYGDIEGKDILIHDDILDTWGSLIKLVEKLHTLGVRSINIAITHGMFNKDAIEKLRVLYEQGLFENIYVTNTVYRDPSFYPDFVKVIDASRNFADPIKSIYLWKSINYNYWVTPATTQ